MTWYVYDCEVFKYDWLIVFKNIETGQYRIIHNNNDEVLDFITDDAVYIGFNSKHYDQYVVKGVCSDFSPEEVKAVNDFIIDGGEGWQCPLLDNVFYRFNNVDIMDDVQKGLSLKAIEAHFGMDIEETEVDFNLDRELTKDELELTIKYCKHDVDATEQLVKARESYLQTKINLAKRAEIPEITALSATNAKLTAMMLHAVKVERTDGREYVYPENVDKSVIPQEVLAFFDTIHDKTIPDDELFSTSLEIEIGGMPCKYAWGGVHGSLTSYHEAATETRVIQNRDVSSLYPSLIEQYNYLSRNVPDPELFYSIRRDRIQAKHDGNKQLAKDLKLPLNTVSGAQENQYNDLYDPLPTRSLRISGQLFLTMLTVRLLNACKTIKLLNLNTDGLMYSIDKSELPVVDRIAAEWEAETRFELETDNIREVWIKDVNNLLAIMTDGEVKTVGGYLNYGISVKGAWAINNNATIVKQAMVKYFVDKIPVEQTIGECNDPMQFQLIAKVGHMYTGVYQLVDGRYVQVQKCNRVYATSDMRYGTLYKTKADSWTYAKVGSIPEHCVIDNNNHIAVSDIDKSWYIQLANDHIQDFLGREEPKKKGRKKMAKADNVTGSVSIYRKLAAVREKFLASHVQKSGKNFELKSTFFELEDIVPVAMPLFHEQGLIPIMTFTADTAVLTVQNMDLADDCVVFTAPVREWLGNRAVTPVLAWGATATIMRRYLYMQALDIVEADEMENRPSTPPTNPTTETSAPTPNPAPNPTPAAPEAQHKAAPATQKDRDEIKNNLAAANDNATELQIGQLKTSLKKLKAAKGKKGKDFAAQVITSTQAFTAVTKVECERILNQISELMGEGE